MKNRVSVATMFTALTLAFFSGSCLPDNDDHSACSPETLGPPPLPTLLLSIQGGEPEPIHYELRGTLAVGEGDIALGDIEDILPGAIVTTGQLWTGGIMPYRIHPDLPKRERVTQAIEAWEKRTGGLIRFVEAGSHESFVEFVPGEGCWSHVGRRGGRQEIGLEESCSTRAVTHEIGHALGLWHEQTRSDRDAFVEVKWCNVVKGKEHNFMKRRTHSKDIGPYDYDSIMHYPRGAFSANRKITLKSRSAIAVPLAPSDRISDLDLAAIHCLYEAGSGCVTHLSTKR